MSNQTQVSSRTEPTPFDQKLNEVIAHITQFANDWHGKYPDTPLHQCISMGAGSAISVFAGGLSIAPGSQVCHLVDLAIAEMAGRGIFNAGEQKAAA
jgi:hypothetical protein